MSFTEDFATQWDYPSALKMVVPSQDRDFHRPRQPYLRSNVMLDDNMALDDSSDQNVEDIKNIQKYFKQSPFGIQYTGPIDGIINSSLLAAISDFQENISVKLNKNIPILQGNQISFDGFEKALKAIQEEKDLLASIRFMEANKSFSS